MNEWDQDIIDTALTIASLERVESCEQIDELLSTMRQRYAEAMPGQPPWNPAVSVPLWAVQKDHAEWREWLPQIRTGGRLIAEDYEKLQDALTAVKATPQLGPNKRGQLGIVWSPWMTGLKSVYTYAAALILDPRNKLAPRIGECNFYGECARRYFIDWREGKGPKRLKFCTYEHENAHAQHLERKKLAKHK